MKEIILFNGFISFLDDDDYEWAVNYEYYDCNGYAVRYENSERIYLHREVLNVPLGMDTDHVNGNRLDNRKSNLRICTRAENLKNRPKYKNNKSGFKGVHWRKSSKKWRVQIRVNGRLIDLGLFDDVIEAAKMYDMAARHHHGEFAKTNF